MTRARTFLSSLRRSAQLCASLLALLATTGEVWAQSAGNLFSGATDADGATAFWNPGALAKGHGSRLDLVGNLAYIRIKYDKPGTPGSSAAGLPKPQPILGGYSDVLGGHWKLGVTIGLPYAKGATWDPKDAEGATTRYYAVKAAMAHALTTLAVSYKVSRRFSFGVGLNIDYAFMSAKFDKDVATKLNASAGGSGTGPFAIGSPELAAPIAVSSSGFGFAPTLGILVRPTDAIEWGASVHAPITASTAGELRADYPASMVAFVQQVAPAAELPSLSGTVTLDIEVPLAVFSALSVQVAPRYQLRLDYRFLHYSKATSDLFIEASNPDAKDTKLVPGSKNRHSLGLRLLRNFARENSQISMYMRWENNFVAERTFNPGNMDFEKLEVAAALRWPLGERVTLALQYTKIFLGTVVVRA